MADKLSAKQNLSANAVLTYAVEIIIIIIIIIIIM